MYGTSKRRNRGRHDWLFMHYLSWLAGPGSLDYLIWLSIWETIKKESEFNLGLFEKLIHQSVFVNPCYQILVKELSNILL